MGFTGTYHGDIRPSTKISDIFNSQLPHNHYFIGNSSVIPVTNGLDSYVNGLTIKIILRTIDQSKTVLQVFEENKIENSDDLLVLMQGDDPSINHAGTIRFQILNDNGDKYLRMITYALGFQSNVYGQSTDYKASPKPTDYSSLCFAISSKKINKFATREQNLPNDVYSANIKTNMSKTINGSLDNQYKPVIFSPYLFDKITHIYLLNGFVAEIYIEDAYYTSDIDLTNIVDKLREESLNHANDPVFNTSHIDLQTDVFRSIEHINRITDKYHIYQNIEIFGNGTNHNDRRYARRLPTVIPKTSYETNDRVGNTFIFQLKSATQGQLLSSVENITSDIRLVTLSEDGSETGPSMAINLIRNNEMLRMAVYPVSGNTVSWQPPTGNRVQQQFTGYRNNHVISIILSKSTNVQGTRFYVSGMRKNVETDNSVSYQYSQSISLYDPQWPDIAISKGVFVRGGYVCRILVLPFVDDDIDLRRVVQKYSQEYVDMPIGVTAENPIIQYPSQEQSYRTAIKNRLGIINNEEYSMDYILELLTT